MGIAILTLRNLARGGALPLLALLLPAGFAGLWLASQGDGTLAGMARLWLEYAMGWTVLLLSAAAVIAGAAAISLETAARRLQLVRVKPVTPLQIWLGHWLGLMLMHAALLMLAGLMLTGGLWYLAAGKNHPAAARQALRDTLLTTHIELQLEPAGAPEHPDGRADVAPPTGITVPPGGMQRWQALIPPDMRADLPVRMEFVFLSARPEAREEIKMLWLAGPADRPDAWRFNTATRHGQTHRMDLPAGWCAPGGACVITCANIQDASPTAVVFPGAGPRLLIPARNFTSNLARVGLMLLARLAFLTALGLTAGAAFSFPVAVFLAGAIPLFDLLNRFRDTTGRHWVRWAFGADDGHWSARLLDYAVAGMSQAVRLLVPALDRLNPAPMLVTARLIPWRMAGQTLGIFAIYTLILAGIGAWLIMRRQAVDETS